MVRAKKPQLPVKYPEVSYTFFQIHQMDWDNLFGSSKVLTDALKVARVIADDSPDELPQPTIRQEIVHKRDNEHGEIVLTYKPK